MSMVCLRKKPILVRGYILPYILWLHIMKILNANVLLAKGDQIFHDRTATKIYTGSSLALRGMSVVPSQISFRHFERVTFKCANSTKGPFTSSVCDAAARSLPNQMYEFCPVLLHQASVSMLVSNVSVTWKWLCNPFSPTLETHRCRWM